MKCNTDKRMFVMKSTGFSLCKFSTRVSGRCQRTVNIARHVSSNTEIATLVMTEWSWLNGGFQHDRDAVNLIESNCECPVMTHNHEG